jgi:integrase/recombinase XerD
MPQRKRIGPRPLPDPGPDPEGLQAHAVAWLEWLRVRNFSEDTVKDRIVQVRYFVEWCAARDITRSSEVTKPILERYQRFLFHRRRSDGKPLTFHTQELRLRTVKGLFKYLSKTNRILSNPASDLELPKLGRRLPKHVLTVSEAEAVLAQPDITKRLGLRDRALLETLYSTAIRRKELANLAVYDIDEERGTVMIRQGKGKKDRMVPIGERALAWIEKYRVEVRPELVVEPDPGALFLTMMGEAFSPGTLTELVRGYVDKAQIGKRGSCHLFRHTVATLMLEGGADVRYVQEQLGHAQLSTTQIYTQVAIRTLKAVHTATHPGARLEKCPPEAGARGSGFRGKRGGSAVT